jgi:ABC-type phosphate/phosphonate transport system substrate-binding protein
LRRVLTALIVVTACAAALSTLAGEKDMLLCLSGSPGTSAQAKPMINKMLRHLEQKLGWDEGSMNGAYQPDGAKAAAQLASEKPGLALVDPSVYVGNHASLGMKVIAKVEVGGHGQETYSVITRVDGPADLAALSGKKVTGAVVHDEKFVINVLLDKKVPLGSLQLAPQKRPLRALRAVVRGKADAAIVDRAVVEHLAELDFADELRVIHTAKPVPPPAVVVMGEGAKNAAALKQVLVGICSQPDGVELCKTLTLTSVKAATDKDYKALLKRYNR